jgi:peptidoglycan/xylan/chitin deacetylase (PgdA/CDA1 family)
MIPFLITIDTEGDNIWDGSRTDVTTENARYLPRFQTLCERYGLKPTYLTNYEMAVDPAFVTFGRDVLARGTAEIGMHLHAWHSPPDHALTANDYKFHPYLIEYPEPVMREKVARMTHLLEDVFATKMRSHRAGRWAFNATYARLLREHGYVVDCSVTPHVDWRPHKGNPGGTGGIDYRSFPDRHYWLDAQDISRPGTTPLLELPVTVVDRAPKPLVPALRAIGARRNLASRALRRIWQVEWLRPNGRNLSQMIALLDLARAQRRPYVEFMIHSSEFMPGGSPYFPTVDAVDKLYSDLDALFDHARKAFAGMTLGEFHGRIAGPSTLAAVV